MVDVTVVLGGATMEIEVGGAMIYQDVQVYMKNIGCLIYNMHSCY